MKIVKECLDDIDEVYNMVFDYFGWNESKTKQWMVTNNPMLGGVKPVVMLLKGKKKKLIKQFDWLKEQYEKPDGVKGLYSVDRDRW
jgi:hypothetical protein